MITWRKVLKGLVGLSLGTLLFYCRVLFSENKQKDSRNLFDQLLVYINNLMYDCCNCSTSLSGLLLFFFFFFFFCFCHMGLASFKVWFLQTLLFSSPPIVLIHLQFISSVKISYFYDSLISLNLCFKFV